MSVLSTLVIDLKGNSTHFQYELKKANSKSKSFAKQIRANSVAVVKSLGAIGSVGAVALSAIYKQSAANIDVLAKQADKLGVTTQALGGLRHAAELSGVSTANMDLSLQRMTRRLSEAAQGGGSAAKAVKELGLDAKKLAALRPDQAFIKITEAMEGVENQSDKVRLAFKFFDSGGVGLVNTMGAGAEALKKTIAEAETLGVTLNRVDAAKIEAANDAMFKGSQVTKGFGNAVAVTLSPYVKALGDEFFNAALEAGGFGEFTTKAMGAVVKSVAYTANAIHGLKAVWQVVKLAAATAITGMLEGLEWLDSGLTNFLNALPGVEAKTSGFISGMADAMRDQMNTIQDDLTEFAMKPLPYDGIVAWAEEAKRKSLEAAEVVAVAAAENGGYTPEQAGVEIKTTDENQLLEEKQQVELQKVKTHEEKLLNIKTTASKKLSAIQEAIRIKNLIREKASQLKIALGDGYVAIQKAWASAPFPLNVPPVALATGSAALNVAAIAGLENGGSVGNRSIVEVGENNKPELLEFGGKNFLLGGNGGAVFNQSQLSQVGKGSGEAISIYAPVTIQGNADESVVAELIERNHEAVYSAMVQAKADRGEEA